MHIGSRNHPWQTHVNLVTKLDDEDELIKSTLLTYSTKPSEV